ncbi:hypothetical protein K7957_02365 [Sphingomonas yunnanensis]|uniref:hypothetical protein n=1 Tax=Sphingomonas yunnanensis TaxID=310400 RepID=UPI001CA64719|nr:hypothetical protein [Sphingomonas yunnanensis]MBY9061774.1 hypothetical protein [Sphingomonas yunnanensis]
MRARLGAALALALAAGGATAQTGGATFAPTLARLPSPSGKAAWPIVADAESWHALSVSASERQPARWAFARSLIGQNRGAEAVGVLDTMRQDEPDLLLLDSFRLAYGAALTLTHHDVEALVALAPRAGGTGSPSTERCAWRLRALAELRQYEAARSLIGCATPALMERPVAARSPFTLAIATIALETGRPEAAAAVLAGMPPDHAGATLLRARAQAQLGQYAPAKTLFGKVEREGSAVDRAAARLGLIEVGLAGGELAPDAAIRQLNTLTFSWRGDTVEERARALTFRLAAERGDHAGALAAGAALLRYFDVTRRPTAFRDAVQHELEALIDPGATMPLPRSATLLWDYRDIVPSGASGNQLIERFAQRLIQAGLYQQAADLLAYQLRYRTSDIAQGPLSARVATLQILAGKAGEAVTLLRTTARGDYTPAMISERQRIQAIALAQLGRVDQAVAILAEVPNNAALRSEILWKQRRWADLVAADESLLPRTTGPLSEVEQTIVLRHAIALAMLSRMSDLDTLHQRYAAGFEAKPSGQVFRLLSGPLGGGSGPRLEEALAALPSVSPIDALAPLLDASVATEAPTT